MKISAILSVLRKERKFCKKWRIKKKKKKLRSEEKNLKSVAREDIRKLFVELKHINSAH